MNDQTSLDGLMLPCWVCKQLLIRQAYDEDDLWFWKKWGPIHTKCLLLRWELYIWGNVPKYPNIGLPDDD